MAAKSIEERVRSLELRLETLIELLAKDGMKGASSARNWRRWIGAFTDDPEHWPEPSPLVEFVFIVPSTGRRRITGVGDFSRIRKLGVRR